MALEILTNSPLRSVPENYCPLGSARWFKIPAGYDAGKTLFYFDHVIGKGPPLATVLFVHGNPECSYTFRHIRDALIDRGVPFRLIAMDHIGFGVSDQANYEMVDMHHSANLQQLVRHLDLRNITLVIHDWGGPIGVGAFADDMDRVERLIVLNTSIFPMPPEGITYANWPLRWLPWSRLPFFVPDSFWGGAAACAVLNANPGSVAKLYLKSFLFQWRFALHLIASNTPEWVFSEALRRKANARSSKRNVLQTSVYGYGYSYSDAVVGQQSNHDYYKKMQTVLPALWGSHGRNIPVAAHFGCWDPLGKDSVIAQWHEALPQMKQETYRYPGFGHFIEEYKGPEIAVSILKLNGISA